MRVAWRAVVVVVVSIAVGLLVEHWKMMDGVAAGRGAAVVRPMAWATGLVGGAVAAVIVSFAVFWKY